LKKTVTMIITVLASIWLLVSIFSLVNASTIESILVRDGEIETITLTLQINQKVKGMKFP
jgi:hypothetical protein